MRRGVKIPALTRIPKKRFVVKLTKEAAFQGFHGWTSSRADMLEIYVTDEALPEDVEEPRPDFEATMLDADFDIIVGRLRHTVIKEVLFDIENKAFWGSFIAKMRDVEFAVEAIDFDSKRFFPLCPSISHALV